MEELNHSCTTISPMKELNGIGDTTSKMEVSDPSRGEATFRLTVGNLSSIKSTFRGFPPSYVRNLPWRIHVHKYKPSRLTSYLGVYLQCNHGVKDPSWSVFAQIVISMIPQAKDAKKLTYNFCHRFNGKIDELGYSEFVSWNELERKYSISNSVTLEVQIIAEVPILASFSVYNVSGGYIDQNSAQDAAAFRLIVRNYRTENGEVISPACYIANLPWKIIARLSEPAKNQKRIDLLLQCNHGNSVDLSWRCEAKGKLRIASQTVGTPSLSKEIHHTFSCQSSSYGCEPFVVWNDVVNDSEDFDKHGSIIVEAVIVVVTPVIMVSLGDKTSKEKAHSQIYPSILAEREFKPLRDAIRQNPELLTSIILQLFKQKQKFIHHIAEHLDAFLEILNSEEEGGGDGSGSGTTAPRKPITISPEDREKIMSAKNLQKRPNSYMPIVNVELSSGDSSSSSDEDEPCPKGTIKFTVNKVSTLRDGDRLSPPFYIGGLPWKIMAMQKKTNTDVIQKSLGFFVQCNAKSKNTSWKCFATAEMKILPQKEGVEPVCRKTEHLYCYKENDWGFSHFLPWNDMLDPQKGFIKNNTIHLEAHIIIETPAGVCSDTENHASQPERQKKAKKKEKVDADSYLTIQVILEDAFEGHQGADLFDPDLAEYKQFCVKKKTTLKDFLAQVSKELKHPVEQIRPWSLVYRTNQTYRPSIIDMKSSLDEEVIDIAENKNPWNIFLEVMSPNCSLKCLPPFNVDEDVLFFFKLYDAKLKKMSYCGHFRVPVTQNMRYLIPILNEKAGFPANSELYIYEEVKPSLIEPITDFDKPLNEVFEELMDGDIIIFQKKSILSVGAKCKLKTPEEYFKFLLEQKRLKPKKK